MNLFYEEPDPDRWFPLDRYPRRVIRGMVRGRCRIGGQRRMFLNLCAGLDKLKVDYRVNDYGYARSHPNELACIIGKPHVLDKIAWKNPIVFGAAVYSHPSDAPGLLQRLDIRRILVPGEWMRKMCQADYGVKVTAWPVGIDTEKWSPLNGGQGIPNAKTTDFLIYNKVMWERERREQQLIQPIHEELKRRSLSFREIRYGLYKEREFYQALQQCKAMIFLCEHETQGIAYQQALSCEVPILAWDEAGFWRDPEYFPHRVKFQPVSSVPYWDDRCGVKFSTTPEFPERLELFCNRLREGAFRPREYIMENLTLDKCAAQYVRICEDSLK